METITYDSLVLPEERLHSIREALYHSTKPGYCLLKGFLSEAMTSHMVDFWTTLDPSESHKPYPGKTGIYDGCPNYVKSDEDGNTAFFNFFWNAPRDEVTYAVAQQ